MTQTKISILTPNGETIGHVGSVIKDSENDEYMIFECSRFCFNNASIAEYYKDKKKFSILVLTSGKAVAECSLRQSDCFVQDHSFLFSPNVAETVKVKAYKNPSYNKEDIETYERWLENQFIW